MAGKTVGVLGAGIGGLVAANTLRRLLPDRTDSVVLIDRSADHFFPPAYLWAVTGKRRVEQLHRPLETLRRRGIDVVTGEVASIRPLRRAVTVDDTRMDFDYLLVALGADTAMDTTPGLAECHTFYTFEGVERLRDALASFSGGPVLIVVADAPFKYSAAAYEAAFLIDSLLRKRDVRRNSPMELVTAESHPLPIGKTSIGDRMAKMLAERDIACTSGIRLLAVDHTRCLATFSDMSQKPFDLIITAPPVRAPEVVLSSGLASETGWISTGPSTMRTMFDRIFAVGDVTSVRLAGGGYLPKAGLFASQQAEIAAGNIVELMHGRAPLERRSGAGGLYLETGMGKASRAGGDFYSQPDPKIRLHKPTRRGHWAKVLSEKRWWNTWF